MNSRPLNYCPACTTWITLVLTSLHLAGCAPGTGGRVEVSGQVTFDGQPIENGSIALVPLDLAQGKSVGGTISGGTYLIPAAQGPLPGKYRVEIKALRKTGRKITTDMHPGGDNLVDQVEQFIPPRYNTRSTLTVEVKDRPKNELQFPLKTK